ncbi:MAG: NAD(+)/NADH kinase [Ruminococcus sp.]|nr:NAD(+)/NADH kinase [Ruminococcus sp.]
MKVGLIVNFDKKNAAETAKRIIEIARECDASVITVENPFFSADVTCSTAEEVIKNCDVAVTVGGDGTIIHNAKFAALYDKPLLGVNLGRIGFAANIEPNELDELKKLFSGDYRTQSRMLLDITLERDGEKRSYTSVNEAAIHRDTLSSIVDISVSLNGERIITYRADGMLFSTATGSTAYSFSAGGPVMQPDLRCILLTPLCPHALSSRPVVFGEDAVLSANVLNSADAKCYMIVDGQNHVALTSDDTITIRKSPLELRLIILKEKNFYTLLNEKLKEN